jgi:hypothetical protein
MAGVKKAVKAAVPMIESSADQDERPSLVDLDAVRELARDERIERLEQKLELANQQLVTLINYVEELLPHARRAAIMMENNPVVKLREAFRGRR